MRSLTGGPAPDRWQQKNANVPRGSVRQVVAGGSSSSSRRLSGGGGGGGGVRGADDGDVVAERGRAGVIGSRRVVLATRGNYLSPASTMAVPVRDTAPASRPPPPASRPPPPAPPVAVAGPIISRGETIGVNLAPPVVPRGYRIDDLVEVVTLKFTYLPSSSLSFHVFVNQPGASLITQREGNRHYVISNYFLVMPGPELEMTSRAPLRAVLSSLGLTARDSLSVQVVPQLGRAGARVTFKEIFLELLTGP